MFLECTAVGEICQAVGICQLAIRSSFDIRAHQICHFSQNLYNKRNEKQKKADAEKLPVIRIEEKVKMNELKDAKKAKTAYANP